MVISVQEAVLAAMPAAEMMVFPARAAAEEGVRMTFQEELALQAVTG